MDIDSKEVIRALKLFFRKDEVFEIRCIDAITAKGSNNYLTRPHIESGYFDYNHIEQVPQALGHIQSAKGIYVTPNPVNKDLLARCAYRIQQAGADSTTKDKHITRRRWLLIDCDVEHNGVSGISSSEDEHENARLKAESIRDKLSDSGWPEPILLDTGNGASLMYAIDLDTSEASNMMVSCIIDALQNFSSKEVKVDPQVKNLSRVWRLPGTMNCKGDNIPERPHRMAHILKVPEGGVEIVDTNLLEEIADWQYNESRKTVQQTNHDYSTTVRSFNLQEWINTYCHDVGEAVDCGDQTKWYFKECPFSAGHTSSQGAKDTYIGQYKSGAFYFKCSHSHCANYKFEDIRDKYEPDWRNKRVLMDSLVNINGIIKPNNNEAISDNELTAEELSKIDNEDAHKEAPWRDITEQDVRNAIEGTLLGELNDIYANVTIPKLPVAASILKSIVTLGCCLSGEATPEELNIRFKGNMGNAYLSGVDRSKLIINTGGGAFCNFYAILIGNSNSGKDIGRLIESFANFPNPSAKAEEGEIANYLVGTSGSAEGIADSLIYKPNGLLVISELQNWLDEKHWMHSAMTFLTDAWDKGYFDYAMSKRTSGKRRMTLYCSPSAIANIQPEIFNRYATPELIESGNFGRWLIACMPNKEGERFYGTPNDFDKYAALKRIKDITDIYQRKRGIVNVPKGYSLELKQMFANKTEPILDATWGRLINQYYPRLAILLSVTGDSSTQGEEVVLTDESWSKAKTLVMWFFANAEKTLRKVKEKDESAFTRDWENSLRKLCRLVCRYYRKSKKAIGLRAIAQANVRYSGGSFSAKQREVLLQELLDRGILKKNGRAYEPANIPEDWE